MVRIAISFIGSFVLFLLESMAVMKLFHYENGITFDNYSQVLVVLILNFFILFTMITQITPWFVRVNKLEIEEEQ